MTTNATTTNRRRQYCVRCGSVHRQKAECPQNDDGQTPQSLASVPDQAPYPYTAHNLSQMANELRDTAIIKEMNGFAQEANHCRQMAARRLREAGQLAPHLADFYERRAIAIDPEVQS